MLGLIGLNYKSAPVKIREQFVFGEKSIIAFVNQLKNYVKGLVLLSTCNRTEIYFESDNNNESEVFNTLLKKLAEFKNCKDNIAPYFYTLSQIECVSHLFHVASGLDSMVLGEYQVVGQLKEALRISTDNDLISNTLIRMFNKAFEASKRVRTETKINKGATSMSYAAVELACQKLKKLKSHPILLVGAGQTGELVVQNLVKKGCKLLSITNRTHQKALELANKYDGSTVEFQKIEQNLVSNDIIITSTGSDNVLITEEMVRKAMKLRENRPLIFIDLSVPRNVANEVSKIADVFVYDVDTLENVVKQNYENKKGEISSAEIIINEVINDFSEWLFSRNLSQTINAIIENFTKINCKEITGFKKNGHDADYDKVVKYGNHLTNKFIRTLIKNVKELTDNGKEEESIKLVNKLFEVDH